MNDKPRRGFCQRLDWIKGIRLFYNQGMERQEITSGVLRSVGYDARLRVLEAEFATGAVYRYFNVPPQKYRGLMAAASHGTYFNQNIRDEYAYMKVE